MTNFELTAESIQSGQIEQFDNLDSLLDFLQSYAVLDNLPEDKREQ